MKQKLSRGFYPFWFWNGDMRRDEIRWQIKQMSEAGIKGFFIHPRQGLKQPYLSESFFDCVTCAIEAAEQQGMIVHLYDEYPYPSGIAGGKVVLGEPQFQATQLIQGSYDVQGGALRIELPIGKVLSVVAYPLQEDRTDWEGEVDLSRHVGPVLRQDSYIETGLTQYNRKRYFASEPTPFLDTTLPEGSYRIYVSVQQQITHFKYWGAIVDVFKPEAIKRFIQLTHEEYNKRYGRKFGGLISSIFVDETAPTLVVGTASQPWSDCLPEEFGKEYGYDLLQSLPALKDDTHPNHSKVSYDFYQLKYRLFCKSFEEQVDSWCSEHGILYSGEKPSLRLSQLRYMGIPGCEPGHTKVGKKMDLLGARIRNNARATVSAAYFYDKVGSLCECYHSMGWSGTIQDAKLIADALLLLGIDYLVPHGVFYSSHGLRKHDAPPSFFFQMPYWHLFGGLSERIDRIAAHFEGTRIDAEILVIDPWSSNPDAKDQKAYEEILDLLMKNHLDYMIADTDILQSGTISDGRLQVKDLDVKLIVLPPMRIVESPLETWLEGFEKKGGKVIRCRPDSFDLIGEVASVVRPSIGVESAPSLYVVKRKADGKTLWFVVNTGRETVEAKIESNQPLREHPLEENIPPMLRPDSSASKGDKHRYIRTVHPFESFLVEESDSQSQDALPPRLEVPLQEPCTIRLMNRNLLRMYTWDMSIGDGDGGKGEQKEQKKVPAVPIINQLQIGKFRYAPNVEHYFGHEAELSLPEMDVTYSHSFECQYKGPVFLVMEPDTIRGEWSIAVNGKAPVTAKDFAASSTLVRGCLEREITEALKKGTNNIQVKVRVHQTDHGLFNCLYLAGDFGVKLDPYTLTDRVAEGRFEDYEGNLMPFYSGLIEYETRFAVKSLSESETVVLDLLYPDEFYEATEVSINGSDFFAVPWEPRSFQFPTGKLKVGENTLVTRVYTSLIRSFEGQWFDYKDHVYRDIEAAEYTYPSQWDTSTHY